MKEIIISPYSQKLRNGKRNPKNYPYWQQVIDLLKARGFRITQIGRGDEVRLDRVDEFVTDQPLDVLRQRLRNCYTWISVDNFFPHLCHLEKKPGIVLWGRSDPKLFGYPENKNLLKNIGFLRPQQFDIWEVEEYSPLVFVDPQTVVDAV